MNKLMLAVKVAERARPRKQTAWEELADRWNMRLLEELHGGPVSEDLLERLERIRQVAMATPVKPVKEQFIVVAKRRNKTYFRRPPRKPPTRAKLKTWNLLTTLTRAAKRMSYEEIAELVGGRVVDVGEHTGRPELRGRKAILLDGQLLNKTQAIAKLMRGKRFARRKSALEKLIEVLEDVLGVSS